MKYLSTSARLTRIDTLLRGDHRFIREDDDCYFIGEYTARQGYDYSETNDKILSLKMKPSIRLTSPNRYYYKGRAIEYWGRKLRAAVPGSFIDGFVWVPIPCSKSRNHPDYDDRLLRVLQAAYGATRHVVSVLEQSGEREAAHDTNTRPTPDDLLRIWRFHDEQTVIGAREVIVFDDVITRGASYRAAKKLCETHGVRVPIRGVFLARTVHLPDDPAELDQVDPAEP